MRACVSVCLCVFVTVSLSLSRTEVGWARSVIDPRARSCVCVCVCDRSERRFLSATLPLYEQTSAAAKVSVH